MPTESGFQAATLVSLDAALDLVLCFSFRPRQLDVAHTAVADIDQVEIVDEAAEEASAAGCIGTDTITL